MKKIFLLAAGIANFASASAQISGEFLDINNVKAKINCEGACFNDGLNQQFEVPKGSGRHSIFEGAIWIGGIDAANTLKIAGETYRQTGTDFWAGPLNSLATTDSATIYNFSRVWKTNKCDIDSYHVWVLAGSTGINPIDSAALEAILTWPAINPDGSPLAPYIDFNANGIYDPYAGDMPDIKGDQAIFFVYNDKGGVHTETGGASLGVEIQGMAYAYSCINDSALYNTIFTHYKIINKSSFRLDSTFIGNWTDFDIGSANDDYIGCDVTRGAYYGYNGDMIDDFPPAGQLAYGSNPPAQAIVFLTGPWADSNGVDDATLSTPNGNYYGDGIVDNERLGMSRFHYYNNDPSSTGNPGSAVDFYEYMAGSWRDGTPMTYGGTGYLTGSICDYMYPGNSDPLGFGTGMIPQSPWDETTSGDIPSDKRGVGSYGPFTMQPGAIEEIDFAYVFARATSGGNLASVSLLQERIDSIREKFSNGIPSCGCNSLTGISHLNEENSILIYPNPASQNIMINYTSSSKNTSLKIYDVTGRLVKSIDNVKSGENNINISELKNGLYLLNLQDGNNSFTKRFIKN